MIGAMFWAMKAVMGVLWNGVAGRRQRAARGFGLLDVQKRCASLPRRRGGRRRRGVLEVAAHDRDALDQLRDTLHQQHDKAQRDQELGRPLRQPAALSDCSLMRYDRMKERPRRDDHDHAEGHQEENVPDHVDPVAHRLRETGCSRRRCGCARCESSVQWAHSRNTRRRAPTATRARHWTRLSKTLRMTAFTVEVRTATKMSHAIQRPTVVWNGRSAG